jgi:hypothetical protein
MKLQYQSDRSKYNLDKKFLLDDSSRPIYRYVSFFQLVELLERKRLHLQKVCYWDDPSEGCGYLSSMQNMFIKETGENVETIKSDITLEDSIRKTYPFGTSWSLLPESDAMWRIYSQDKMGVKIQTSVKKLEQALSTVEFPKNCLELESFFDIEYVVGKVDYAEAKNINDIDHFLSKKEAFKHEEEVRGLVKFSITSDPKRLGKLNIQSDIKISAFFLGCKFPEWMYPHGDEVKFIYTRDIDFIEALRIDPRADDRIVDTIKSYCRTKKFNNIERSGLYEK